MKKMILAILLIATFGLIWYLFIKEYDYQFRTTARYSPGAVFSELSDIRNFASPNIDDELELVSRERFSTLIHKLRINNEGYLKLHWDLAQENDSITALTVSVTSSRDKLRNRWEVINPFQKSIFIDSIKSDLLAFKKRLDNQQQAYDIKVQKELADSPGLSCVCSSSKNIPVSQKALEMVRTISFLEDYLLYNDKDLAGLPFLKVTKWNEEQDIIDFDFCFPVDYYTGELTETNFIKLRQYPAVASLKAEFRGNYRISHIAWYELLYHANKEDITTTALPLEVFYNDPRNEDRPANWKADIYLSVK